MGISMEWLTYLAENSFYEFAVILLFAALLGALGQLLRQPLIVMFIALGILLGPSVLDIVKSHDKIELLAEIGIAVLLFIVGLKLDFRIINSVGKVALLTGMGQVFFTSLVGYVIGLGLGFSSLHSFYIAVALTFSSTIIIVKLLSDKKEIDSLHGQIAIGFLIVQDIVVILVIIILSSMGQNTEATITHSIIRAFISGAVLLIITLIMMRWIIPWLSHFLAKSPELLVLFAVAWAIAFAAIGKLIGFSGEVGAFLAGVSLASSQFKDSISSRMVSLRDFMLLFFFVNLGANLDLSVIGDQIQPALLFSVFVLVGNPIIVLIIMGLMGYRKRTSFLAGLTVAQISEFSLIFAGLGLAAGHLNESIVGLITLVGLITIGVSTYLILYSHQIYNFIAPALHIFERKKPYEELKYKPDDSHDYDLVIFGMGRFGSAIARNLNEHPEVSFLGVDFDPQIVKFWQDKGKDVVYGDIEDPDIFERIPFENTKTVISTVKDLEHNTRLLNCLRAHNYKGKIYVTMQTRADIKKIKDCNNVRVLLQHEMAARNFYNEHLKDYF